MKIFDSSDKKKFRFFLIAWAVLIVLRLFGLLPVPWLVILFPAYLPLLVIACIGLAILVMSVAYAFGWRDRG